MGLVCNCLLYLILFAECGLSLECKPSNFKILVCSGLYFAWLILDNIDGKQARKTRTSSPLGLMCDHQVDALTVTIACTFMGIITLYGNSWYTIGIYFVGMIPFFFATWEEYHVGAMEFPMINGACDGCLILGIIGTVIGVFGPDYFRENTFMGVELIHLMFWFFIVASILTGFYK